MLHLRRLPSPGLVIRLPALAVSLTLALVIAGCDSATPPRRGPCGRAGAPPGCGEPCGFDFDCEAGLYCGDDLTCTADCSGTVTCTRPMVCDATGRCAAPTDGGVDRDAPPYDAGPLPDVGPLPDAPLEDGACGAVELSTTRSTPNVIVIVDRSGSMGTEQFPPGSGVSRWTALRNALIDPATGLLFALDSSVRFGFVTYRNLSPMAGCPHISLLPALLDNADEIASVYSTMTPFGPTPTGDAITATLARLSELVTVTDEPTVFVLATDGEPNTCESATDEVGGRAESVAAVAAAYAAGIRTFVLSVGTDVSTGHLQEVANAGVGRGPADPPATFWVATDVAELSAALGTIIGDVASCDIELVGAIDPSQACLGTVTLDGRALRCGDPDGWQVVDATHIRLLGAACNELQTSGGTVSGRFPCEVVVF